ncbi:hypothetical protein [Acinetobacter nosocomialis]|uniref:hypothetical protein n=1 Tax=Acinetobacter nosocomialis TaxID=106654 RepID=UPI003462D349
MDVPLYLRTIRLLQRYLKSVVKGKKLKETLKNTIELIQFTYNFDKRLEKFLSSNSQLSRKVISVRDFSSDMNVVQTNLNNLSDSLNHDDRTEAG